MIWEAIAGGIKGFGDTVLGYIKEFHLAPEAAAKLEQAIRQAEMDFQRQVWQLEAEDRNSARNREISTGDNTTKVLAYSYTGGYFAVFICLISGLFEVQVNMERLVDVLLAVLTAGQYSILTYYFGSSHGSQAKDSTIDKALTTSAVSATVAAEQRTTVENK